ncbi:MULTISPECIES: NAD(P)H-binding protein [unclassified Beijerinckia]|uniref:SDR family oxidoreductase n=1 Tax=unclassified Beijerinckia TaxID=2638183 RepID=UPI00147E25E3|nr:MULTISPECIES: NAD(P)H-binding protein [unclassified Beijerinckia]
MTGGTGALGRRVVDALERAGVEVRSLSRGEREPIPEHIGVQADLLSKEDLAAALVGIKTVVHCAHDSSTPDNSIAGTTNLIEACQAAGVRHFVYISIAGIDTAADFAYYAVKLEEERRIIASGLPYSILRAAQFHNLVHAILMRLNTAPMVMYVPRGVVLRPVDIRTVADRLADIAQGPPRKRCRDLVGPEQRPIESLARQWLRARGQWKIVFSLPSNSPGFKAFRELTLGEADKAGPDFALWLVENVKRPKPRR